MIDTVQSDPRIVDEAGTIELARVMATQVGDGGVMYLRGDLGAGKTTFARALLQALGIQTRIKSPTYSLVESYSLGDLTVQHLDLYRIADPGELEWLGLADLLLGKTLLLIEWPERGGDHLPAPDLTIALAHAPPGRELRFTSHSILGASWVKNMHLRRV